MNTIPPICYYPTTVVLVDDNHGFLESMSETLRLQGMNVMTFDHPEKAFAYIETQPKAGTLLTKQILDDDSDTTKVNISFDAIMSKRFDTNRHNEISVVIADYDMPGMKGDDFLSVLGHPHLKKIMLTGAADHATAIDLLNHKIIDSFVEKHPSTGAQALSKQITKLKQAYFDSITQPITEHLLIEAPYLGHKIYQGLVADFMAAHQVTEHYLTNSNGSRVMCLQDGREAWLSIASEADIAGWLATAEFADAPKAVIDALVTRSKIPVFTTPELMEASPQQWTDILHPADTSVIDDTKLYIATSAPTS